MGSQWVPGCIACSSGSVTDMLSRSGAVTCLACSMGSYSTRSTHACTECAAGKYVDVTGSRRASDCIGCAPGKYVAVTGSDSAFDCIDCVAGRYFVTTGAADCIDCVAGKHSSMVGSTRLGNCINCGMGKYTARTASTVPSDCIDCEAGRYSGYPAAAACIDCVAGKYSSTVGSGTESDCIACAAAKFSVAIGAAAESTCTDCAAGSVTDTLGATGGTTCTPCAAGTYTADSSQDCINCAAGKYVDVVGSDSSSDCIDCVAGRYVRRTGSATASDCIGCVAGKYASTVGSTAESDCTNCGVGKYTASAASASSSDCIDCVAGRYSERAAAGACIDCAAGRSSDIAGSSNPDDCGQCPFNQVSGPSFLAPFSTCEACEKGKHLAAGRCSAGIHDCTVADCDDDFPWGLVGFVLLLSVLLAAAGKYALYKRKREAMVPSLRASLGAGSKTQLSDATVRLLALELGCKNRGHVLALSSQAPRHHSNRRLVDIPASVSQEIAEYQLSESLGSDADGVVSRKTVRVLLGAKCFNRADVIALRKDDVAALHGGAPKEVVDYLGRVLRSGLAAPPAWSASSGLTSETLVALATEGCRTKQSVEALSAQSIAALPGNASEEVAEYLLREPTGFESVGVLSSKTLAALLQAGCRTKASVVGLRRGVIAGLPLGAVGEVKTYLAKLLRGSLGPASARIDDATLAALVRADCRTDNDVQGLSAQAIAGDLPATASAQVAEYLLRDELGIESNGVASAKTLVALLLAGCRTKASVTSLPARGIAALRGNAPAEIEAYLPKLLRTSLGATAARLDDATLAALVRADCRTASDVNGLSAQAIAALPGKALEEVAEHLLRDELGIESNVVISAKTLVALLLAGCRTKASVVSMSASGIAALRGNASAEVEAYLAKMATTLRSGCRSYACPLHATCLALLRAGCRTASDVDRLSAQAIAALPDQGQEEVADYLLRAELGIESNGIVSAKSLIALLRAGCRTKASVTALRASGITTLGGNAPAEVEAYLAKLLGPLLGATSACLDDATLAALVRADCRTDNDVKHLSVQAIGALSVRASEQVAEYLLRDELGRESNGVLSARSLAALLRAGCRTQARVTSLHAGGIAALGGNAATEVAAYLAKLLRPSFGAASACLDDATLAALVRADCRTDYDVKRLSAPAIAGLPGRGSEQVAEYVLRDELGIESNGVSAKSLLALLQAGCRTKANVTALGASGIAALGGNASAEVAAYRAKLLRPLLGAASARLDDATLAALVRADCRTDYDVKHLSVQAIGALPSKASEQVAEVLLRDELGKESNGVLSARSLAALLRAGCRTKADVLALKKGAVASLPLGAVGEVKQYLEKVRPRPRPSGGLNRIEYNHRWKTGGTPQTRPLPTEFYHGTSLDAAIKIQQTGRFRPSTGGMMGKGVYMANAIRKTEGYMKSKGLAHGGVLLKLKVDLGRCKRVTSSGSSWIAEGYDSVWWDKGSNMNENCVKDPSKIEIIDAFLGHAAKAQEAGYFVENGKVVQKAPKAGWVMAGAELAPTEFYHGTSLEGAVAIQNHGFNVNLAGKNDGDMLGAGAYLTTSLLKAYMYADNKHHGGRGRPHVCPPQLRACAMSQRCPCAMSIPHLLCTCA
eukprot:COSAG04_NODE_968_length_9110_cov_6.799911_5_plen_1619_part_00